LNEIKTVWFLPLYFLKKSLVYDQALYLDTVDLNCIVRAADSALPPAHSTTAESSAGPSGKTKAGNHC